MISAAACDIVNGKQTSDSNVHNPQSPGDGVLFRTNNICNLPVELKQKIAFNLNSVDYASLRATGKTMCESLDSFSVMNVKRKQRVAGELRDNMSRIIDDRQIRSLLSNDSERPIVQGLKNCTVREHILFDNCTSMSVKYLPYENEDDDTNRIENVMHSIKSAIVSFTPSFQIRTFYPEDSPRELDEVAINFSHSDINSRSLNDIFSSLNQVFQRTDASERFIVASMASRLRTYWLETPPAKISKEEVNKAAAACPELLRTGNRVVNIVRDTMR